MDLTTLGKTPIHDDHPAGSDVRYEPIFEDLQAEIDKLSLPSAAGTGIDWKKVADTAAIILAEHSKDLLVAGYFGVARIHQVRIEGLCQAIQVFSDLLEHHWDILFPAKKRMRGRLGAMEWWLEKSEIAIEMLKPAISQAQQTTLIEGLDRLDQLMEQCFPEPPSLRPLRSSLEPLFQASEPETTAEQIQESPPPPETSKPVPPPAPETHSPAPKSGPVTPAQSPSVRPAPSTSRSDAGTAQEAHSAERCLDLLLRAVGEMEKNNPTDPQVYRLRRLSLWAAVEDSPPANQQQTLIPPPDPQTQSILQTLHQNGDWINLVSASENQLTQNIFWLDCNRYTAEALEHSGGPYRAAHEAVCQETAHLIRRMPELPSLTFSDGSPLADQQTKEWLETIAGGSPSLGTPVSSASSDSETQSRVNEIFMEAQQLVRNKNLIGAVKLIQGELDASSSDRNRLQWRLILARILLAARKATLAGPHFESILQDIHQYHLEKWEPELALQCYKVILTGHKSMSGKDSKEKAEEILGKIAALNPLEALSLE